MKSRMRVKQRKWGKELVSMALSCRISKAGCVPGWRRGAATRRCRWCRRCDRSALGTHGAQMFLPSQQVGPSRSSFDQCLRLPNNSEQRQKAIAVEFARSAEEFSLQQIYLFRSVWMFSLSGNRPSAEVSPDQNHNHNHNHACIPVSIRHR